MDIANQQIPTKLVIVYMQCTLILGKILIVLHITIRKVINCMLIFR